MRNFVIVRGGSSEESCLLFESCYLYILVVPRCERFVREI